MKNLLLTIIFTSLTVSIFNNCTVAQSCDEKQTQALLLNLGKVGYYFSSARKEHYLAVVALDESVRNGKLFLNNNGQRKIDIIFENSSGKRIPIQNEKIVSIHLGEWKRAATAKKYKFFRFNLLIDTSGSVDSDSLNNVKNVLKWFIQNIPPVFEAQIISFSSGVEKKSGFIRDESQLISQIQSLVNGGKTALFDAISVGINELKNSGEDIPLKFSIVLTDGKDTGSTQFDSRRPDVFQDFIDKELKRTGIPLFIIGVTDDVNTSLLKALAGGFYQAIQNFQNIDKAFKIIETLIEDTYIFKIPHQDGMENGCKIFIVERGLLEGNSAETIQNIDISQ